MTRSQQTTARAPAGGGVAQPPAAPAPAASCTIGEAGNAVQLTLTSADATACTSFAQTLARSSGGFWRNENANAYLSLVCVLRRSAVSATVMDSGYAILGHELCSGLQANGWIEDVAAETSIEASAASASALAAAASASAAAAAARASQQAADYQGATQTLSALQQATSQGGTIADDVSTLGKDTGQAATDLTKAKSDAAQGQGDFCYGVTSVYYDAVNVVGYDENNVLGYDLKTLAGDITNVRSEANHLSAYTAALQNEGVTPPPGASDAIAAAQKVISSAIAQANADIDAVASDVAQAYKAQNAMVTGACSSSAAAGDPPSPPAHLF